MAIVPLYNNVSTAIKHDADLSAMLALTDAIRIGHSRERNLAVEMLDILIKELQ